MKTSDIKSEQDILDFIEGTFNDFEAGVSDKEESIDNIISLICFIEKRIKDTLDTLNSQL